MTWSRSAAAVEPASVQADEVTVDAEDRMVEARGHVRVDAEPFHLQSDALTLTRSWRGIEIDGKGRLSFCRCLSFPLALSFDGGAVGPPHDLVLQKVRLELFDVPFFYLPLLWIRSPARTGMLMPELALRGRDGFYASAGLHVPLVKDSLKRGLDLRVGGYARGGVAVQTALRTENGLLRARFDHLDANLPFGGTGVAVDARGAHEITPATRSGAAVGLAWDADALIGRRALGATTSLQDAARPYDRARFETHAVGESLAVATGLRWMATRGSALEAVHVGPYAALGVRRALLPNTLFDGLAELGSVGGGGAAFVYGRAEAGVGVYEHAGPVAAALTVRGAGGVQSDGEREARDTALLSGVTVSLPLARGYGDPRWPLRHRLEPAVAARVITARGEDPFGAAAGRGLRAVRGEAGVAEARLLSSVGKLGRHAAWDLELAAGSVASRELGATDSSARPVLRLRQALSTPWLALMGDGATDSRGSALAVHGRLGARRGLSLATRLYAATGIEPLAAHLLIDPTRETPTAYVGREGATGGASLRVPLGAWVAVQGGADVDLREGSVLGARAGVELRDRCGCFVVRLQGSQRLGRDGTDVWLAVDLVPAGRL